MVGRVGVAFEFPPLNDREKESCGGGVYAVCGRG